MYDSDCIVAGAGVVGLAVARRLAAAGLDVLVLEAAESFGTGISARNSEVIHAGLYYPTGSLKARLCVAGRAALYAFCDEHGVAHRRLGKLIVATTPAQLAKLDSIRAQAAANGVDDLTWLDAAQVHALEPALNALGALNSPSTGIVDSHGLMLALLGVAEAGGATLVCRAPVIGVEPEAGSGFRVHTGGPEATTVRCRRFVNACGLDAGVVAAATVGLAADHRPRLIYAKGNYFGLSGVRCPFGRLIYPVPEDGGLGVHLTLDLAGQPRFGPDVEWLGDAGPEGAATIDYRVDPRRGDRFYGAIRTYWPGLPDGALAPAYAGMRPKLSGPGQAAVDFLIAGPEEHGVDGLVNLFGIESPGLTSCLALADVVAERLGINSRDGSV